MWSLGCVTYELLTKAMLFPSMIHLRRFVRGEPELPFELLKGKVSDKCINFVQSTVVSLPSARPTAATALQHSWMSKIQYHSQWEERAEEHTSETATYGRTSEHETSVDILTSFMESMGRYKLNVSVQNGLTVEVRLQDSQSITWFRQEKLGGGLSGVVWAERESTGGRTRAVKRLSTDTRPELDYRKELFAMVKVSEVCQSNAL
jgi:serine/threonine protein kinase